MSAKEIVLVFSARVVTLTTWTHCHLGWRFAVCLHTCSVVVVFGVYPSATTFRSHFDSALRLVIHFHSRPASPHRMMHGEERRRQWQREKIIIIIITTIFTWFVQLNPEKFRDMNTIFVSCRTSERDEPIRLRAVWFQAVCPACGNSSAVGLSWLSLCARLCLH